MMLLSYKVFSRLLLYNLRDPRFDPVGSCFVSFFLYKGITWAFYRKSCMRLRSLLPTSGLVKQEKSQAGDVENAVPCMRYCKGKS